MQEHQRTVEAGNGGARSTAVELCTIAPGLVTGPAATRVQTSSTQLILRFFNGTLPAVPDLRIPAVDTRDVANIALRAMLVPEAAGRRFLLAADYQRLRDVAPVLRRAFAPLGYNVPSCPLPGWILRAMSYFDPAVALVLDVVGPESERAFDASATLRVLGLAEWRPVDGSAVVELAASMLALGAYPDKTADQRFARGTSGERYRNAVSAVPAAELAPLLALAASASVVSNGPLQSRQN